MWQGHLIVPGQQNNVPGQMKFLFWAKSALKRYWFPKLGLILKRKVHWRNQASAYFSASEIWLKNEGGVWEDLQPLWRVRGSWPGCDTYICIKGGQVYCQAAAWVLDIIFFIFSCSTLATSSWSTPPPPWPKSESPPQPAGSCPPSLLGWGSHKCSTWWSSSPTLSPPPTISYSWIWEAPSDESGEAGPTNLLLSQLGRFLVAPSIFTHISTNIFTHISTNIFNHISTNIFTTSAIVTPTTFLPPQLQTSSLWGLWQMCLSLWWAPWLLLRVRQRYLLWCLLLWIWGEIHKSKG